MTVDAKTDNSDVIGDKAYSSVYMSVAEDWTSTDDTYKYYVGGGREGYAMFGLGNYNYLLVEIDLDGVIESRVLAIDAADHLVAAAALTTWMGQQQINSTCVTAMDSPYIGSVASIKSSIVVAGNTGSAKNCVDWAIDGFNVAGHAFAYSFTNEDYSIVAATPAPGSGANMVILTAVYAAATTSANPAGSSGAANYWNNGAVSGL